MAALAKANKLYDEKKWQAAIDAYKKCIESELVVSDEQKLPVYNRLGSACDELDRLDDGVEWFSKAIKLNQRTRSHAAALFNRGSTYLVREEFASAVADFTLALAIFTDPEDLADTYFERSRAYRGLNACALEMADLQNAISLHPDSVKSQHLRID